jgi:hypothetical protein
MSPPCEPKSVPLPHGMWTPASASAIRLAPRERGEPRAPNGFARSVGIRLAPRERGEAATRSVAGEGRYLLGKDEPRWGEGCRNGSR